MLKGQQLPKQLSSEAVRLGIERLYDVSSLECPVQMPGGENAAWHLRTNKGDWVVKVFAPHEIYQEKLPGEPVLYEYLNQHGVNAPKVLLSRRGRQSEEMEIDANNYPILVMKLEDLRFARSASIRKDELIRIAQTIAWMHGCLQRYPYDVKSGSPMCDSSPWQRVRASILRRAQGLARIGRSSGQQVHLVKEKHEGYHELVTSPNVGTFTSEELAYMRVVDQKMNSFLSYGFSSSRLTRSILHNDLALEHTPFLINGNVYVYDFADRGVGPTSKDLAVILHSLFIVDKITYERWQELKDWLFDGYTSVAQLTSDDSRAVLPFLLWRVIEHIIYFCSISKELQRGFKSEYVKRNYQFADYLLESGNLSF